MFDHRASVVVRGIHDHEVVIYMGWEHNQRVQRWKCRTVWATLFAVVLCCGVHQAIEDSRINVCPTYKRMRLTYEQIIFPVSVAWSYKGCKGGRLAKDCNIKNFLRSGLEIKK